MTKTSAELEQEVEASRGHLDRTVEALKEKMTPTQLFGEFNQAMGGAGNQILAKLGEQAKENPMPLLVIGAGLAWLMMGSGGKSGSSGSRAYAGAQGFTGEGYTGQGYSGQGSSAGGASGLAQKVSGAAAAAGGKVSDLAGSAQSAASNAASSAADMARHTAANAADMARQTGARLKSAAGSAGDAANQLGHRAQDTFASTLQSEPLILAALGVAVGAAIGAALPSTSIEDEKIGALRDQLVDKTKTLVQDQLDTAKDVATSAYTSVKSELDRQGGPEGGGTLAEKIGQVAQAGVQAVQEKVQAATSSGGGASDGEQGGQAAS